MLIARRASVGVITPNPITLAAATSEASIRPKTPETVSRSMPPMATSTSHARARRGGGGASSGAMTLKSPRERPRSPKAADARTRSTSPARSVTEPSLPGRVSS